MPWKWKGKSGNRKKKYILQFAITKQNKEKNIKKAAALAIKNK